MKVYLGYTRTEARANLDQLWALLLLSECEGDPPALPAAVIPQRKYWGHTGVPANADVDAMWDALPGAIPAAPDPDGKVFRAFASTLAYANLDALVAAIAPLTCCAPPPPPACVKILDEQFNFATPELFKERWEIHTTGGLDDYDIVCDGETTQMFVKDVRIDGDANSSWEAGMLTDVRVTPGAPIWMRFQFRFDLMPAKAFFANQQQQIAFGADDQAQVREWFAFAVDDRIGGKFYSNVIYENPKSVDPGPGPGNPGYDHNGVRYGHSGGDTGTPPGPGPGAGIMGFAVEDYYDGFATLWELVVHTNFEPHGVVRQRTFIGPVDGPKVPMSDGRVLAPGSELLDYRLSWVYHSHKNDGVKRAGKMKHVEAWECSYAANPCGVEIVVPDPTGPVASLEIVQYVDGLLLDDWEEVLEPIGVVARDADGNIVPGVRPEFIPFNNTGGDSFESGWHQGVVSGSEDEEFDVKAWWPDGGAGIESNSIHVQSLPGDTPHRFWKVRADAPDNAPLHGIEFSIAGLQLHEGIGGPDVAGLGTVFGSPPLAGTSLANALDGNPATFFTATGQPQTQEIGIDFGVGVAKTIAEGVIIARTDRPDLAPPTFSWWSSPDGVKWMRHQGYHGCIWTSGQARTFNVY